MVLRIGQSQVRLEDDTLLRGAGSYAADQHEADEAHMVVLRSPVGAGKITDLDTDAAKAAPGVIAVLTGRDAAGDGLGAFIPRLRPPAPGGGEMLVPEGPPIADDRVRHVGEPVAVVIAATRAEAEDAAELIGLEIDSEPALVDPVAAVANGAAAVFDEVPGNLAFVMEAGDAAAVRDAFAVATHVVEQRFEISRVAPAPIEPRAAVGSFDAGSGTYLLRVGTQSPHRIAGGLAPVLGVEPGQIRVVARHCGGSFGMKNNAFPEQALLLWAARRTGRPVRWISTRVEAFLADAQAREQVVDAGLALDADGRFLGLRFRALGNIGARPGPASTLPLFGNIGGLAGVYRTPAIHAEMRAIHCHTQNISPYRGAGRPEATYVIERLIDLAAAKLGRDRAELRRANMIRPDQMPFKTGLIFTYDSGDFPALMDRTLELADWAGFEARRAEARERGRLRGIGIANPIEIAGGPPGKPNPEFVRLEMTPDGELIAHMGSCDAGQGHATMFRQIIGERLGIEPERITLVTGDTGKVERGVGTFGSRTVATAGTAIVRTSDEIISKARADAAEALEVAESDLAFEDGAFVIAGTDRRMSLAEVAETAGRGYAADTFSAPDDATFPNGCHICEVEIDPDTGATEVVAYVVVDDVGVMINPLLVKGQIQGGIAQGLGQALLERIVYEPGSGQLLTASFMDYAMPRADNLPQIAVESFPVPTKVNPLGAKGAGEAGTVGALAAVISAIADALGPLGIAHIEMPATPERVWRAVTEARGRS